MVLHKHHIVPRHRGGTDDPSNIIKVNVAMHAWLHEQLYLQDGKHQDYLASQGLKGLIGKPQIKAELCNSWRGVGMTEARKKHYNSESLKDHGKWLADTHSVFKDSSKQSELGKRAAASANHPNNRTDTCIHCNKTMNLGHIARYHNDKCKERPLD